MSSVDVKVSKKPNGSMSGIHPKGEKKTIQQKKKIITTSETLTSCIFERKAPFVHFILFCSSPRKIVYASRRVSFHLQRARPERPLFSNQNIEIVVRGVQSRMTFRSQWCAEDDQVLGDARVDDVHGTHSAARVAEHPFLLVWVKPDLSRWVRCGQVGDDVVDHGIGVRWVRSGRDSGLRKLVKRLGVEDIPLILCSQ